MMLQKDYKEKWNKKILSFFQSIGYDQNIIISKPHGGKKEIKKIAKGKRKKYLYYSVEKKMEKI